MENTDKSNAAEGVRSSLRREKENIMNMNVDLVSREPSAVNIAVVASQAVNSSLQSAQGPVGTAEPVLNEDTYQNKRDSSSDGQDQSTPHRAVQISVSEETGVLIKVINSDTKEVVREIPPEDLRKTMAAIRKMSGLIFDRRA
jgi:uncharacterized FlaG/YvyC family protein